MWNVRAYPAYVAGNRKGIFGINLEYPKFKFYLRNYLKIRLLATSLCLVCVCAQVLDCYKSMWYNMSWNRVRTLLLCDYH